MVKISCKRGEKIRYAKKTFHCEPQWIQKAPKKVHERITGNCLSTSRCYLLKHKGKQKHFMHRYSTLMQIMLTHVKWPGFLLLKRQDKVPFSNRGYIFDKVNLILVGALHKWIDFVLGKAGAGSDRWRFPCPTRLLLCTVWGILACLVRAPCPAGPPRTQVLKWIRSNYVVDMRC